MRSFYLRPKAPYTWEDLELEGANFNNAEIVETWNGEVVGVLPFTPFIEKLCGRLKYEKGIYQDTVLFVEDRELPLEKEIYEDVFRSGCSPFKQAIVMAVSKGAVTVSDIIKYVLEDLKILKKTQSNIQWLRKTIGWMTKEDYLVYVDGVLKLGIRRLPLGSYRVPIRAGYNPILYEIMEMMKLRGAVSKSLIASYMITNLNWIENDPVTGSSARDQLDHYLRYLVRNGYATVANGKFSFVRPLEPY